MKREDLKALELTDEQIDGIMAIHGKGIEKLKSDNAELRKEQEALKEQIAGRDQDMENLKTAAADAETIKSKLAELENKYKLEKEEFTKQLYERDYAEAIRQNIADKKIIFSSKAAEKAYINDMKAAGLKLENGKLMGFDDFHKMQIEADPAAFQSPEPPAKFTTGMSNTRLPNITEGEALALAAAKARSESLKSSQEGLNHYIPGDTK